MRRAAAFSEALQLGFPLNETAGQGPEWAVVINPTTGRSQQQMHLRIDYLRADSDLVAGLRAAETISTNAR